MKSRTSFFDQTLFKKDITRFSPVWILYTIGGLLVAFSMMTDYTGWDGYTAYSLACTIGPMALVNLVYAMVVGCCLFGDLFNTRMCNALHTLPLRREAMFLTHTAAGLLFSIVPNTLMALVCTMMLGKYSFVALLWLLGMTLEYLFFFSLAAFCAVCTGSRFAMGALYALINFFSMLIYWFVETFYAPLLPGLHIRTGKFETFSPAVELAQDQELLIFEELEHETVSYYSVEYIYKGLGGNWIYLAVLAGLAVVLLGLGIWLYRKRPLESAGDFVAFRPLVPVCSVIFTLSIAAIFQIMGELMDLGIVTMVVGFLVGCFGTEMLLRRTVKVFDRKTLIKSLSIGAAFALTLVITTLDPMGLTRWTPEAERVESVTLSENYKYSPGDMDEYFYYNSSHITITDPQLIEELVKIHELLVQRDGYSRDDLAYLSEFDSIHLTYKMSDGTERVRRYYYAEGSETDRKLAKFYTMPQFVLGYEDWEDFLDTVVMVSAESADFTYTLFEEYSGEAARGLLEAIRADCEAGREMEKYTGDGDWFYIHVQTEKTWLDLYISEDCENTVAYLTDHSNDIAR